MSNIRNLVFSGTGINGAGFVGAISQLEKESAGSLQKIERVAGTNSGAIIALLLALNFSAAEIEKFYLQMQFVQTVDCQPFLYQATNESAKNSTYDGDFLLDILLKLFQQSGHAINMTFAELANRNCKDLHIGVFKRDENGYAIPFVFSAENTPDTCVLPVALASASISIPKLFPNIYMRQKEYSGQIATYAHDFVSVDDIFTLNLAIHIFDKKKYTGMQWLSNPEGFYFNPETLGFLTLSSQQEEDFKNNKPNIKIIPPRNPGKFFNGLLHGVMHGRHYDEFKHKQNAKRTILIKDQIIPSYDHEEMLAQKKQQIETGMQAVKNFYHPQAVAAKPQTSLFARNSALASSPLHKKSSQIQALNIEEPDNKREARPCVIL